MVYTHKECSEREKGLIHFLLQTTSDVKTMKASIYRGAINGKIIFLRQNQ